MLLLISLLVSILLTEQCIGHPIKQSFAHSIDLNENGLYHSPISQAVNLFQSFNRSTTHPIFQRDESVYGYQSTIQTFDESYTQSRPRVRNMCSMYGSCRPYDPSWAPDFLPIDCPNYTAPIMPDFDLLECPMLKGGPVCCDHDQYREFVDGFAYLKSFLSVCRACVESFRAFLCSQTCSPDQAFFQSVNQTIVVNNTATNQNVTVVTATDFWVATDVVQGLYDSCKGVILRSTGQPALNFLSSDIVDVKTFAHYVLNSPNSPVTSIFHFDESNNQLDNQTISAPIIDCADPRTNVSCACYDCPHKCDRCQAVNQTINLINPSLVPLGISFIDQSAFAPLFAYIVYLSILLLAWTCYRYQSVAHALSYSLNRSNQRSNQGIKIGLVVHFIVVLLIAGLFVALFIYLFVKPSVGTQASDQSINQLLEDDVQFFESMMDPLFIIFILATAVSMVCSIVALVVWFTPYRSVRYTREDAIDQAINQSINQQPINDAISQSLQNQSDQTTKLSFRMRFFLFQSRLVVNHPVIVMVIASLIVATSSVLAWRFVTVNTDPIKLWVAPSSQVMKEKQVFDQTFGPFFRTEQLIIRVLDDSSNNQSNNQSLFTPERLRETVSWIDTIKSLTVTYPINITYQDLCYRPIPNQGCVVESPLEYFIRTPAWYAINEPNDQGEHPYAPDLNDKSINQTVIIDWIEHCSTQFAADECRGSIGAPTFPWVVFGGNQQSNNQTNKKHINYEDSSALVITFPLNNLPENVENAKLWEKALIDTIVGGPGSGIPDDQTMVAYFREIGLSLSFMSERSIEDEITRGAFKDALIIGLSYVLMFAYIGLALSSFTPQRSFKHSNNQSNNRRSLNHDEDASSYESHGFVSYLVGLRFGLALTSIVIVVASLVISVAINIMFDQSITPIISEVIPFLVLAIGIDNVFILFDAFNRQLFNFTINQSMNYLNNQPSSQSTRLTIVTAATLNEVGPSIVLASISEAAAFLLGAATDMPAVQAFALYSAIAVLSSLVLQMTVFLSILVIDQRRIEAKRADLLVCLIDTSADDHGHMSRAETPVDQLMNQSVDLSQTYGGDDHPSVSFTTDAINQSMSQSFKYSIKRNLPESTLQRFIRRFYLPFLFHRLTMVLVVLAFPAVFVSLLTIGLTRSELGLDQATVLPDDSYMQAYFHDQRLYLDVGPPVYFVIPQHANDNQTQSIDLSLDHSINQILSKDVSFQSHSTELSPSTIKQSNNVLADSLSYDYSSYDFQNLICSLNDCDDNGLMGLIAASACRADSTLAVASSSWLDTYLQWISTDTCCLQWTDGTYRSYDACGGEFPDPGCSPCIDASDLIAPERAQPGNFSLFLDSWMRESVCESNCAFCSAGLFDSIRVTTTPIANTNLTSTTVQASRYMSYHTPLRQSHDFIAALHDARALSEHITAETGLECFPYSVVYVYFQQYIDISKVASQNVGLAFGAIFLLSLFVMRDARLASIVTLSIAFIIGDLLGLMVLFNVSINALSVLNLIMAIGISVEFCIHLSARFQTTAGRPAFRAAHALYTIGASVFSGIACTKATGIAVLAFASSAVFQIYYFRMYLFIVLLAVAHGLVWLPVVLALVGSEYRTEKSKRSWRDWLGFARTREADDWLATDDVWEDDSGDEKEEPLMN